jgi:hypothetical protein
MGVLLAVTVALTKGSFMRPTVCRSTLNYTPTSEISATSEIKTQTAEPFQRKNPKLNTCSRNLSDSAGDAFDVLFALGG